MNPSLLLLYLGSSKTIDAPRDRGDDGHLFSDQFLLWGLLLRLIQDNESNPIIFENTFNELWSEASKAVSVSDDECMDSPSLSKSEESSQSPSFHIES